MGKNIKYHIHLKISIKYQAAFGLWHEIKNSTNSESYETYNKTINTVFG